MSRYHTEFDRLYAVPRAPSEVPDPGAGALLGADGQVRAMVLDIGRPVEWPLVASMGRAVQEELELPAPAIAISGDQSFQLWWSLAEPVPAQDAQRLLQAMQRRFLPSVKPARARTFPTRADAQAPWIHVQRVPHQVMPDQWSAFVAPGLAPVFEETPWVDFPPNEEGQAELLSGIRSVSPAQWKEAWERLEVDAEMAGSRASTAQPGTGTQHAAPRGGGVPAAGAAVAEDSSAHVVMGVAARAPAEVAANVPATVAATVAADAPAIALATPSFNDPRHFLLHVMNNSAVPLPLRIEAAKALLPYSTDR